ncbi:XRE family transcriptional regulator [Streptomyces sp. NPDC015032]|uniref:XRE family transcriptional regulator n=1 Tax=Streptomyces sp. NPDC015032 TaxID=3364937 RepID=UPI0036F94DA3
MKPEHGGTNPLADLLRAIGWNPEQLVARINERRGRRGCGPLGSKSAYPWVRAAPTARPHPTNQVDALAVLSTAAGRPVTAAELGWDAPRVPGRRKPLDAPGDAAIDELLREITEGDLMDRRNLLLLTGTATTAPALAMLLGPTSALAQSSQHGGSPSARLVDSIEEAVKDLRDLDDTDGSTEGLDWAGGLWRGTARVVTRSTSDTPATRRLHTAFIELSEQYGWMSFDANRHAQAQRIYHTGMRLAAEASPAEATRKATSNLLASAAYQAAWLDQHTEATAFLAVAERTNTAAGNNPALAAVIAERQLFAAGRRGDTEQLRHARDTAHDRLEQAATESEPPWWCQWLSHPAIDAATGRAWLAARQPQRAEPHLARRVDAVSLGYPRDHMLAVLDLANAHHRSGHQDQAASLHHTARTLAARVDSPRAHLQLRRLSASLAP